MPPAISIVMPCYNAADTLPETLASIAAQTQPNYELIAIDDGSSDHTAHILAQAAAHDDRIKIINAGRVGLVAALNLGLAHAQAALIARMDADDLMRPERLAQQQAYLNANPQIALVSCQVDLFPDELIQAGYREYVRWQNQCLTPDQIANNIYIESPLPHPSVMFRRSVVAQIGPYRDGDFPEDYEYWLRMHAAGLSMAKLDQTLLSWRENPTRTSRVDSRYARSAFDQLRAEYLARDPRLHSDRPLVVWGAGRKTRLRSKYLLNYGFRVSAWIDIDPDKIGHVVWDAPVCAPDWLDQTPRPLVLVYVTAHGAREYCQSILEPLGYQLGCDYFCVG
jgi:glycosyltransferase involved in cell wall biosynthesis